MHHAQCQHLSVNIQNRRFKLKVMLHIYRVDWESTSVQKMSSASYTLLKKNFRLTMEDPHHSYDSKHYSNYVGAEYCWSSRAGVCCPFPHHSYHPGGAARAAGELVNQVEHHEPCGGQLSHARENTRNTLS